MTACEENENRIENEYREGATSNATAMGYVVFTQIRIRKMHMIYHRELRKTIENISNPIISMLKVTRQKLCVYSVSLFPPRTTIFAKHDRECERSSHRTQICSRQVIRISV